MLDVPSMRGELFTPVKKAGGLCLGRLFTPAKQGRLAASGRGAFHTYAKDAATYYLPPTIYYLFYLLVSHLCALLRQKEEQRLSHHSQTQRLEVTVRFPHNDTSDRAQEIESALLMLTPLTLAPIILISTTVLTVG